MVAACEPFAVAVGQFLVEPVAVIQQILSVPVGRFVDGTCAADGH